MYEYKVVEKPIFDHRTIKTVDDKWNKILKELSEQGWEYYFSYTDIQHSHNLITGLFVFILLVICILYTAKLIFPLAAIISIGIVVFCSYTVTSSHYHYFIFRREMKNNDSIPQPPLTDRQVDSKSKVSNSLSKEDFLKKYPPSL